MSEWDRFGVIETERMHLEPITLDAVELFVELDSDPEVMRYINGGKPSRREYVEEIVRANLGYRWVEGAEVGDVEYELRRAEALQ